MSNSSSVAKSESKGEVGREEAVKAMMDVVDKLSSKMSKNLLYFQQAIQNNFSGKASKRKRESSIEYGFQTTPTKISVAAKRRRSSNPASTLDIDWEVFKGWPEGLKEEERAFSEYLDRLRMVIIEQKTKIKFIESTKDEVVEGNDEDPDDGVSAIDKYTMKRVQQLEAEAEEVGGILQERQEFVASIRNEIENLTDELHIYNDLEEGLKEAKDLTTGIKSMRDELKRLRESSKAKQTGSSTFGREKLTREEAEKTVISQLESMMSIQSTTDTILKEMEVKKRLLVEEVKELEGLKVKQKNAEKVVKELKSQSRDIKIEELCKAHLATLSILKSLLGVVSIEAPEPTCLRIVYKIQGPSSNQDTDISVAILIHFNRPGGRIESFELQDAGGKDLTSRLAPVQSPSRAHLDRAILANDASLLLQELLLCVGSSTSLSN